MSHDVRSTGQSNTVNRREFLESTGQMTAVAAGATVTARLAAAPAFLRANSFDWRMAAGTTITVSLEKHQMTDSLLAVLPHFEAQTGIKVRYSVITAETINEKLSIALAAGGQGIDVVNMDPFHVWVFAGPNGLRALDDFLRKPQYIAPDYNWNEILPNIRAAFRWNLRPGGMGQGSQWGVPLIFEQYTLQWRADRFSRFGITKIPQTLPEVRAAAKKLTGTIDGKRAYGIGQRGSKNWTTIHPGFISMLYGWGGRDFDSRMRCTINSPAAVAYTDEWLSMIRESGPPHWLTQAWIDDATDFLAGTSSMVIDADIEVPYFNVPKNKEVYRQIATTLIPAGPTGVRASNMWALGLSIPLKAPHPEAAWLFIQWASHRKTLQSTIDAGYPIQDTVRPTVANSPSYVRSAAACPTWLPTNRREAQFSRVLYTAQPEWQFTVDTWVDALQQAYLNPGTTKQALDTAANQIDEHMRSVGLLQ